MDERDRARQGVSLKADDGGPGDDEHSQLLPALSEAERASEPKRGKQKWRGAEDAKQATYANRRRINGPRGKRLLRKRGELIERSFAHCYETGAMRRLHLRGRENIAKRLLVHAAGFNLGLLMRKFHGLDKPRSASGNGRGRPGSAFCALIRLATLVARRLNRLGHQIAGEMKISALIGPHPTRQAA